jgi:hypothetical protein
LLDLHGRQEFRDAVEVELLRVTVAEEEELLPDGGWRGKEG